MAIAFAHVSIHTRTKGHSSVAGSAYRAGDRRIDNRTGEIHDYSNRNDVQHAEMLLPEAALGYFESGEALWNAAEIMEKRKDAQVAKDVMLALPKELSFLQQVTLARNFADYHFVAKGLAVEFALHDHSDGNPHVHIYVTTRRLTSNGFDSHKARDLNPTFANSSSGKGFVSEGDYWGEQWRNFQQDFFNRNGLDLQVDENHLFPTAHEGTVRGSELHYIKHKNQLQRETAKHIALNDTDSLLNLISQRYAVFTERQIANIVFKATSSATEFQTAIVKLKAHPDIICLGTGEDDSLYYTTRQIFQTESLLVERATELAKKNTHALPQLLVNKILKNQAATLTEEQFNAVRFITTKQDIAIVVGRAGTGKSFMLKTANSAWEQAGFQVYGISVSGIAAKNLQDSSHISSSTLARFKKRLEYGKLELDHKSIVVMDEAGMTNLADMAFVMEKVIKAHAKLVLVGDPEQLQPIGAGAPFRALAERIDFTELDHIQRQQDPGDRIASNALARGEIATAISHYERTNKLHWQKDASESFEEIANDYLITLNKSKNNLFSSIILAHRNDDVDQLNTIVRKALIKHKLISTESISLIVTRTIPDELGWNTIQLKQEKPFTVGDKILFRKNDKSLGVSNGEFSVIKSISSNNLAVAFQDGRTITFDPQQYREFDYGYAATVHKAQGLTVDHAYIYFSGQQWDRHLTYVALTRHRQSVNLYVNKPDFGSQQKFISQLSRRTMSDNVLDWPLNFAKHRGFDSDNLFKRLLHRLGEWAKTIRNPWELKTVIATRSKNLATPKNAAYAKPTYFNWLSPEYKNEWNKLQSLNNDSIKLMLRLVNIGNKEKNESEKIRINKSITELAKKIASHPKTFNSVQQLTPKFAEMMKIQIKNIGKRKVIGLDR